MEIFGLSKKSLTGLLLIAAALSSGNSYASKILLDFEGASDRSPILDFYNNGTDASGNSGTNYGAQFSNSAVVSISIQSNFNTGGLGLSGNFTNQPSGKTAIIFHDGGAAMMNVESGFGTDFSLYYTSSADAIVNIYDGLNGTGNLLGSLSLAVNYNNNCTDPFQAWCHWDQVSTNFTGRAYSVVFDGPRDFTFYDNISFNSESISEAPVPGAFWLMGSGIISLLRVRRK
jgi:hypothetical protein